MEDHATRSGQKKTVDLDRGIFIVRYSSAEDEAFPPKVQIFTAPGSDDAISAILHPDEQEAVLWQPGSGLVVQAVDAGQLMVEVTPTRAKGSASATVKIESLSQGKPAVELDLGADEWRAGRTDAPAAEHAAPAIRVLGHVAGRGDVVVGGNEWIGGPSAPSRIEGIAVEWPGVPRGLTVRYAVKTARPNAASGAPVDLGAFAGTRGRAMPLVGMMLELSGAAAPGYEFVVEAVFLGSPAARGRGQRVTLSGPTEREPLVGLRLSIEQAATTTQPRNAGTKPPRNQAPNRVRVFRSTGANRG